MHSSVISIRNLSKKYNNFYAVKDLNLEIEKGVVFGFLGPNGAGKSTTLRMLLSLINPTSGEIEIFGKSLKENRSQILSKIGSIIEKPDFYLNLNGLANLKIQANLSKVFPSTARILEIIDIVGLRGRELDKVKTYSHGMKQRLGLAQALIHDPEIIVLDEPTTGLDPQGIIDLRELILRLKLEMKKTVILSSHILSEIELIADNLTIIDKGKAVVQGKVQELLSTEDIITTLEPENTADCIHILGDSGWKNLIHQMDDKTIELKMSKSEIPMLMSYLSERNQFPYSVTYKRTLEDYFLKLTQKADV